MKTFIMLMCGCVFVMVQAPVEVRAEEIKARSYMYLQMTENVFSDVNLIVNGKVIGQKTFTGAYDAREYVKDNPKALECMNQHVHFANVASWGLWGGIGLAVLNSNVFTQPSRDANFWILFAGAATFVYGKTLSNYYLFETIKIYNGFDEYENRKSVQIDDRVMIPVYAASF